MRYAIALTSALLLGGATATLALQPIGAQPAQNEPGSIAAVAPKPGAPMSFADMVARLQPAVVNISTNQTVRVAQQDNGMADLMGRMFGIPTQPQGPSTRQAQSLGSGFIISPDGYIVTNNHVVSAGTTGATVDSITVTLPDRKEYKAKLIGRDVASDLAVLKIEPAAALPFVKFGDSARARVGDWVVAIGNPFGLGSTVTAGIVSALHRVTGQGGAYDRFIQTDASINQGNSGGPMFNLNGDVIGINSQIFSPTGGNVGIGFAIPAEEAKPIIDTLMKGGAIARGYIGVSIGGGVNDDVASALGIPKNQGDIITRVEPDGPAARAGIRVGDVVTRINGQAVTPDETLTRLVANVRPGATARFDILRDGKPLSVNVTVTKRPSEEQLAQQLNGGDDGDFDGDNSNNGRPQGGQPSNFGPLGIDGRTVTPGIAQATGVPQGTRGVAVLQADPNSDAAQKLRYRDVITQINFTQIASVEELNRVVGAAKAAGRDQVVVYGFRQRNPLALTVKIR